MRIHIVWWAVYILWPNNVHYLVVIDTEGGIEHLGNIKSKKVHFSSVQLFNTVWVCILKWGHDSGARSLSCLSKSTRQAVYPTWVMWHGTLRYRMAWFWHEKTPIICFDYLKPCQHEPEVENSTDRLQIW